MSVQSGGGAVASLGARQREAVCSGLVLHVQNKLNLPNLPLKWSPRGQNCFGHIKEVRWRCEGMQNKSGPSRTDHNGGDDPHILVIARGITTDKG